MTQQPYPETAGEPLVLSVPKAARPSRKQQWDKVPSSPRPILQNVHPHKLSLLKPIYELHAMPHISWQGLWRLCLVCWIQAWPRFDARSGPCPGGSAECQASPCAWLGSPSFGGGFQHQLHTRLCVLCGLCCSLQIAGVNRMGQLDGSQGFTPITQCIERQTSSMTRGHWAVLWHNAQPSVGL
jgi:hypothetical protein